MTKAFDLQKVLTDADVKDKKREQTKVERERQKIQNRIAREKHEGVYQQPTLRGEYKWKFLHLIKRS